MRLSFVQRVINIPAIFFYYLSTFVFPYSLSVDQLWIVNTPSLENFYFPLLINVGFFLGVFSFGLLLFRYARQKFYIFLFFSLWFFAGIGLYMQVIPLDMTVADRWFYVPIVGILGMIGVGVTYVVKYLKLQKFFLITAILVILCFGVRTIIRISDYQNEMILFSHDIKVRDNYDLEMNLGADFFDAKDISTALVHLKKSVALFPSNVNLYDLAYVYEQAGDIKHAQKYYEMALTYPSYAQGGKLHTEETYVNLARVLLIENKVESAHTIINQGLAEYPSSFSLQFYLVLIYYKEGENNHAELLSTQLYQTTQNANAFILYNSIKARRKIEIPDGVQKLIIDPK
ncbi:MAG: hypothetical protein KGL95_11940, partial [Patescibacteria group bacterium]|nr:hypothetical protein [Patescibacteria group bacterium]